MRRSHRNRFLSLLVSGALALAVNAASAQGGYGGVGTEIDDESGYLVLGSLGGNVSSATSWDLTASRFNPSTASSSFDTTSYGGSLFHDFGRVGLRVGLGGWRDDGLVQVDQLTAALQFRGEGWSFELEGRMNRSDFDPFDIDRTIILRDGTPLTITARADCSVDDTGLGARLRVSSGDWSWSVSGMAFDYGGFGCDFGLPMLDRLRDSTRDEFVQFADRVTDVLSLSSGRRLLAETSFLDSRLGLGVRRDVGTRSYSANFDRVEDVFFGRVANTLSGGVGFVLRSGAQLEVYAGATEADASPNIAFVGLLLLVGR